MCKHAYLSSSILSLVIGLGAAFAAQAGMATYACQFDPAEPAGLTVSYDTATGQFALVDYYGTPSLPSGVQVSSFAANGPMLAFSLNIASLEQTDSYRFNFPALQASLSRQSASGNMAQFNGVCTTSGQVATTPPPRPAPVAPAAPTVPTLVALPYYYGTAYQATLLPELVAAVQRAQQTPAIGTPTSGIAAPSNSICTRVSGQNDRYIEASWCASTQLESSDFNYGGILGFINPDAEYGREPAWCTSMGGYGNFGQGHSIELKYWLPATEPEIRGLVIRSGTGIADNSPYLHSKPRVLRVESPDMTWTWTLEGNTDFQAIIFDQPFQSEWVRVVIEDAYMGDSWSNICISDLFALFESNGH